MKVLKAFKYSTDGVTLNELAVGDDASVVPAEYLPGLVAQGYVEAEPEAKAARKAPANKAIESASEDKAD